jgi:hypothetical protein
VWGELTKLPLGGERGRVRGELTKNGPRKRPPQRWHSPRNYQK